MKHDLHTAIVVTQLIASTAVVYAAEDPHSIAGRFRGVVWNESVQVDYIDPSPEIASGYFPQLDVMVLPAEGICLFVPINKSHFVPWDDNLVELSLLTISNEVHLQSQLAAMLQHLLGNERDSEELEYLAADWGNYLTEESPQWAFVEQSNPVPSFDCVLQSVRVIVPISESYGPMGFQEALVRGANSLAYLGIADFQREYDQENLQRDRLAEQIESTLQSESALFVKMSLEEMGTKLESLRARYQEIQSDPQLAQSPEFFLNVSLMKNLLTVLKLRERTEVEDAMENWKSPSARKMIDAMQLKLVDPSKWMQATPSYINQTRMQLLVEKPDINHKMEGGVNPTIAGTPLADQADPSIRKVAPPSCLAASNEEARQSLVITTGNFSDLGDGAIAYKVSWDDMPSIQSAPERSNGRREPESSDPETLHFLTTKLGNDTFNGFGAQESMDELLAIFGASTLEELDPVVVTRRPIATPEFFPLTWKCDPARIADNSHGIRQWVSANPKIGRTTRVWTSTANHEILCTLDNFGTGDPEGHWIRPGDPAHDAIKRLVTSAAVELGEPEILDDILTPYVRSAAKVGQDVGERMGWMKGTGLVWHHPEGNMMVKTMGKIDVLEPETGPLYEPIQIDELEYTIRDTGTIKLLVDTQTNTRRHANGIYVWVNLKVQNSSLLPAARMGKKPVLVNRFNQRTYESLPDESVYLTTMKDIYAGIMADELLERVRSGSWSREEMRGLALNQGFGFDQLGPIEPGTTQDCWVLYELPELPGELVISFNGGFGPEVQLFDQAKHRTAPRLISGRLEIFGMRIIERRPLERKFKNLNLDSMSGNIQIWRSSPQLLASRYAIIQGAAAKADEARRNAAEQQDQDRKEVEQSLGDL